MKVNLLWQSYMALLLQLRFRKVTCVSCQLFFKISTRIYVGKQFCLFCCLYIENIMLYNKAQWQCYTCLKLIQTFFTCLILTPFITHNYPCDVVFETCSYCIILYKNVWTMVAKFKCYRWGVFHQVDI